MCNPFTHVRNRLLDGLQYAKVLPSNSPWLLASSSGLRFFCSCDTFQLNVLVKKTVTQLIRLNSNSERLLSFKRCCIQYADFYKQLQNKKFAVTYSCHSCHSNATFVQFSTQTVHHSNEMSIKWYGMSMQVYEMTVNVYVMSIKLYNILFQHALCDITNDTCLIMWLIIRSF